MQIGSVAKQASVGVETVRFYERKGLIQQPHRAQTGGFRDYQPEIVEQIRFIRLAQGLGFSLKEIKDLLSLRADPNTDCAAVRKRAEAKLQDVTEKIAQLESIKKALRKLIRACPGSGPASKNCSVLEALEPTKKASSR